jgi:MFS transporter, DHA1 family, multidrug resistance protein
MTATGAKYGRTFLLLCAVGFAGFFASYLRIPVLPLLATSLGGGPEQVGLINASFMLAAGSLSIPGGLLADRLGRRTTLLAGLLGISASSFLIAVCTTPLQMAAVYLLFGTGLALFAPTMMSLVADVTPAGSLGSAYGWYTTAVYAAMTCGPAAGGFIAREVGLRQVFLLSGSLVLLLFFAALFLRFGGGGLPARRGSIRHGMAELLRNRPLVASLTVTLGSCFGYGMFITFLPLHARSHGLDPGRIGIVFACQALVNALSRIPFGRLGDLPERRRGLVTLGFGLLGVALAPLGFLPSLVPLALCGAVIGVAMAAGYTAIGAIIADSVPRELRGLSMGMYNSCIYLGMMLSSAVMGPVIRHAGFGAGFLAGGGVCAAATAAFALFYPRTAPVEAG